ncbi:MAG TPA: DUF512 domain-containing protein, partial [Actinomycetota bacterium]|nr:DUF512 domain-containing protein [Actinomycetota bacterium]
DRPFPPAAHYGDFPMHEDGIGMARAFEAELLGRVDATPWRDEDPERGGFFHSADAGCAAGIDVSGSSDADYEPYRAVRATADQLVQIGPSRRAPVAVLTGAYGARVLAPLLAGMGRPDVRLVTVDNRYFGGNVGVSGLMVGEDLARVLAAEPEGHRYLLPDVCLTRGVFLDGTAPADLPRPVEIVPTDGHALRAALDSGA